MVLLPDSPPPVKRGGGQEWEPAKKSVPRRAPPPHAVPPKEVDRAEETKPRGRGGSDLTEQEEFDVLCGDQPVLFQVFLDGLAPVQSGALLGAQRTSHVSRRMSNPVVSPVRPVPRRLSVTALSRSRSPPARSATALGPDWGRNGAGIPKRSFLRDCESLAPSPLSEGVEKGGGRWGRCARACGVGVVVRWGGGVSSARSLSFSLALQGGADGDDGSERERFHRIFFFSRKQAGGALEDEGGEEEEGKLRETHLTRTIWLTSEQPSSNHVRWKIIQMKEPFKWQTSPPSLVASVEIVQRWER